MPGEWELMNRGSNTQDLSGYDDATAQLDLKRKLRIAQALQEQQAPQGQMVGNVFVAPSWTQNLANLANRYVGRRSEEKAIEDYNRYNKTQRDKMAEALGKFGDVFKPKDVVTQGTYDIEKPVEQTQVATSPYGTTEQLGATSPWTSNVGETTKTISVPMSTTQQRQPTMDDIRAGFAEYAKATNNPKLLEEMYMKQFTNMMTPKKYSIHNIGDAGIELDEYGKPTGLRYDFTKPPTPGSLQKDFEYAKTQGYKGSIEDFKRISTSWLNPYQQQEIGIQREKIRQEEEKNNPLGLPKDKNNTSGNLLNVTPKVKKVSLDNGTSVSATYDDRIGKWYVIQDGKKYWVEE